jgi:hypothetical protein
MLTLIILWMSANNNLSQYLYNPKSDIPMLDIAPSEKGITGVTPESDVASKVIYDVGDRIMFHNNSNLFLT